MFWFFHLKDRRNVATGVEIVSCLIMLPAFVEGYFWKNLPLFYFWPRIENIEFVSFVKVSKNFNQWFRFSPFSFMAIKPKTDWPLKIRRPADEVWLSISECGRLNTEVLPFRYEGIFLNLDLISPVCESVLDSFSAKCVLCTFQTHKSVDRILVILFRLQFPLA